MNFENRQADEVTIYLRAMRMEEERGAKLAALGVDVRVLYAHQPISMIMFLETAVAIAQAQTPALKLKRRLVLAEMFYARAIIKAAERDQFLRLIPSVVQNRNENIRELTPPTSEFVAFLSTYLDLDAEAFKRLEQEQKQEPKQEQKQEVPKVRLTLQQERNQKLMLLKQERARQKAEFVRLEEEQEQKRQEEMAKLERRQARAQKRMRRNIQEQQRRQQE